MKLHRFAICSALCLAPFLLTACNGAQVSAPVSAAPTPEAATQVHQLQSGLKIEMLPMKQNDLAQLLGARLWRFCISSEDKSARMLTANLKIERPNQASKNVGGVGVSFDGNVTEVVVGIQAVGKSFSSSDIYKANVRIGGGTGTNTFENPFKASKQMVMDQQFRDDDVLLMSGRTSQKVSLMYDKDDVALVLAFSTTPMPKYK